jgi:hypothetical protein
LTARALPISRFPACVVSMNCFMLIPKINCYGKIKSSLFCVCY